MPSKSKLATHMVNELMYSVYWNQVAAAYLSHYFFIFLSLQFSNVKKFLSHFSQEMWCLQSQNLVHLCTMNWCILYARIGLLVNFLSLLFPNIEILVTFFSGTVRYRKLKLNTNVKNGSMYCVYWNQAAHTYSFHYFFFFLSLQFSITNLSFSSDNGGQ